MADSKIILIVNCGSSSLKYAVMRMPEREQLGKGLVERIPAEMELPDGSHKGIKLIKLTAAGAAYDHTAAIAAYEAEQAAAKATE